jgi:hypothetical protein
MEHITRTDIFVASYLNQGYEIEDAVKKAKEVIKLLDAPKQEALEMPTLADDIVYTLYRENFTDTIDFIACPNVKLSLVNGKVHMRSSGIDEPHVQVSGYGRNLMDNTSDVFVWEVITMGKGLWVSYPEFTVGVNYNTGRIEWTYDDLELIKHSAPLLIKQGETIELEINRKGNEVNVYLTNLNTTKTERLYFACKRKMASHLTFRFAEDVVDAINLTYLSFGVKSMPDNYKVVNHKEVWKHMDITKDEWIAENDIHAQSREVTIYTAKGSKVVA